jgi:lipoate-protein ligase A
VDAPGSGGWNMAVDEALLLHSPKCGPSIRFYTWDAPTVSLGYRQRAQEFRARAEALGVPVVRRVTGGGAVLHERDLTYTVVAPAHCSDLPDDLRGSYLWIRSVLLSGLRSVGFDALPARPEPGAERLPVCFAGSAGLEIELERTKLVGSAQRRLPDAFLQHGSIRLHDDSALHSEIFGERIPSPPKALSDQPLDAIVDALRDAFATALGGCLRLGRLTSAELETANSRRQNRRSLRLRAPAPFSRRPPRTADTDAERK